MNWQIIGLRSDRHASRSRPDKSVPDFNVHDPNVSINNGANPKQIRCSPQFRMIIRIDQH